MGVWMMYVGCRIYSADKNFITLSADCLTVQAETAFVLALSESLPVAESQTLLAAGQYRVAAGREAAHFSIHIDADDFSAGAFYSFYAGITHSSCFYVKSCAAGRYIFNELHKLQQLSITVSGSFNTTPKFRKQRMERSGLERKVFFGKMNNCFCKTGVLRL